MLDYDFANASKYRYAMKCLDKKRIKLKQGETLALNERIMLSHVRINLVYRWLMVSLSTIVQQMVNLQLSE